MTEKDQPGGSALSKEQAKFLVESGSFSPEELAETQAQIARGELAEDERATRLEGINASVSAAEVAAHLGVNMETVANNLAAGELFAFAMAGEPRFPNWQFTGDARQPVLPGLAQFTDAFADKSPASILGFMTTMQRSARIDGVPMTPVNWLLEGGDPQVLREILDSFLQS